MTKNITENQLDFISHIEIYVQERFSGTTRKEASEYIDRNKDLFHELQSIEMESRFLRNWSGEYDT